MGDDYTTDHQFPNVQVNLEEFDKHLPETVTLLSTPEGGKLYLIGTGHFSKESQDDVSKVIEAVQPHIVVVELCVERYRIMKMDEETVLKEAAEISYDKIKQIIRDSGIIQGIVHTLLLKLSASLTKNHGIAPGGEFRCALKEIKKLEKCLVVCGDRPLQITMKRAVSRLSWWQSIRIFVELLFAKTDFSYEEIEQYKKKDMLEEVMDNLVKEYPELSYAIINERDIFLTHSLQLATSQIINVVGRGETPPRVVGIVGIGHCSGIKKLWGTVKKEDVRPVMIIPEPTTKDLIIKKTFKIGCLCLVMYSIYYVTPKSWKTSLKSISRPLISSLINPIKKL